MRAVVACLGVWFLAVSPACAQFFRFFGDSRAVTASGASDLQAAEADTLMPFDVMVAAGTPPVSSASASQTSRLTATEIFISGGTGDVLWQSGNENAGGQSAAVVLVGVDSPTPVRIHYELAIDTTSFRSWTGGARFRLDGQQLALGIGASTVSDQGMNLAPAEDFIVGADGYARTVFDEIVMLLPGPTYELRTDATSRCPGPTATDTCVGKPITFTTHLVVIPEPATWLAALLATIGLSPWRRFV